MTRKRRWLWVFLFVSVAVLLSLLATGWNVVLVRDYQHLLDLARNLSLPDELIAFPSNLIFKMILGTLGFVTALTLTVLLFIKLLHEMRLNQVQSEFLASMSHELKTPIAAMTLSSSLIRTGGLSESEVHDLWDSHQVELKRLSEEVETLLEAARWQAKPSLFEKRPMSLESWITQSYDRWKTILGPQAILAREGDSLNVEVQLDSKALRLITDNLLNNAKKFSVGTPHVVVRTSRIPPGPFSTKSRWRIQFQDHGWGFNPADSKKIFHRFFRSRGLAPYAIPGTGLGLYLARSASRAMGLNLQGESSGVGHGAVFTLEGKE